MAERGLSARTRPSLQAHRPFGSESRPSNGSPNACCRRGSGAAVRRLAGGVEPVFSGTFDQDSLFFECGQEVLTGLHRTLAARPISLMLTDADGVVLNRMCDERTLLRQLDDVHLAPGFSYSERQAGTNGLGLALADQAPTLVRAEEHYVLSLCIYTCAAAPVLDPFTGRLEGAST